MTKLPAAATLQGDVRTAVSGFIAEFNAFASLPKDWKAKYQVASASLDKMLAAAAAAPAVAAPADSNAPGKWDPTVVEALKKVRTQLDAFEKATGDPLFIVKDIEKLLDAAGAASGTVTLDAAKPGHPEGAARQNQGGCGRRLVKLRLKCEILSAECEVRFGVLDLGCVWVASDAAECRILEPGGSQLLYVLANSLLLMRFAISRSSVQVRPPAPETPEETKQSRQLAPN
jgi:hypothetical protein